MTQEQVALRLGVSTPAVNKWERGASYPDITLIPVLARLLKTDANTLLSFQDDITAEQNLAIQRETDRLVREEGYDAGFRYAVDAMREYSACDQLACILTMYLDGALSLYGASEGGGEGGAALLVDHAVLRRAGVDVRRIVIRGRSGSPRCCRVSWDFGRHAAKHRGRIARHGGKRVVSGGRHGRCFRFRPAYRGFRASGFAHEREIRLLEGRGSFRVPFRPRGVVERRSQLISHAREPHAFDRPCRFLPCVVEFLALRISSSKLDCLANIKH